MNLSDIQGNSLIISIAFTLLIGAIIVYYLNARIISVEKSITRQNTILGEFIANIRNEIAGPMVSVASHQLVKMPHNRRNYLPKHF